MRTKTSRFGYVGLPTPPVEEEPVVEQLVPEPRGPAPLPPEAVISALVISAPVMSAPVMSAPKTAAPQPAPTQAASHALTAFLSGVPTAAAPSQLTPTAPSAGPSTLSAAITQILPASAASGAAAALQAPEQFRLPPRRQGQRAKDDTPRRSDIERVQLNVRIREELKRAAAAIGALQGVTLGDVVEQALIEYINQKR